MEVRSTDTKYCALGEGEIVMLTVGVRIMSEADM